MVDPFVWLWLLCFSMLSGSFLAGNVPLAFHFSEHRLRDISSFGAGLLVGTALSVIVPEGVETLYGAYDDLKTEKEEEEDEVEMELTSTERLTRMRKSENSLSGVARTRRGEGRQSPNGEDARSGEIWDPSRTDGNYKRGLEPRATRDVHDHDHATVSDSTNQTTFHGAPHVHDSPHRLVGLALTTGFVFMLLVEQFAHHDHSSSSSANGHRRQHQEFSVIPMSDSSSPVVSGTASTGGRKGSATIGLVVHAAADGIALGAASSSKQSSLEMIVFVAIMLHKAPSAFGLCTYLLHEGLTRRQIRQHLALFSVSAPLSALFTFAILHNSGFDPLETRKWTGVLLLFSAGTFLHVAIHIMNQVDVTGTNSTPAAVGTLRDWWNRWRGFAVLVAGVAFPLVVSVEHGH